MTEQPLTGRRLWMVGIGGTGMSALAAVCHAWGAEVAGSDREATSYTRTLEELGIEVVIGHSAANLRAGWEVVVSSAILPGNPELVEDALRRGELLAELVSLRPSIVVAGAHGKTTTTAMIAFVLDRLGLDPAFLIGGAVPQLGGNARAGEGWLVAEGDESDRSLALLAPRIAVLLNVDLDHHVSFASLAEVQRFFEDWLRSLPVGSAVIRGDELEPVSDVTLAVPGEHNRRNAAAALAALAAAGVGPEDARRALAEYRGAGRRFEPHGEAAGVRVYDDYGHHPAEIAAALATARGVAGEGRVVSVLQPHLYSRTLYLHQELAEVLTTADVAVVTEVCGAREAPVPGVSGRLVLDRAAELRPGMPLAWAPALRGRRDRRPRCDAPRRRGLDPRLRGHLPGDPTDSRAAGREGVKVKENVGLYKHTTLGTGGPARWFATPETVHELVDLLGFARDREALVAVIGLGSNLLVADDGFPGLVLRLSGSLTYVKVGETRLVAGGGASLAVCLHRARDAGLGGLEFASAIPGTIGGAVWMNAGAYSGELKEILVRAMVATADGTKWLSPAELGLRYRRSDLVHGQVIAAAELQLVERPVEEIRRIVAELQETRKEAQPTNKRTFGSVFKNPEHDLSAGRMLDACGLRGHRVGGAQISPKHANFIENVGGARTEDVLALIGEARRRAKEQFGVVLEPEVQLLGDIDFPPLQ